MTLSQKRPLRAAGISGSSSDRRKALARMAQRTDIDFIFGDWMSEVNMSARAEDHLTGKKNAWEPSMMRSLEPALENLAKNKIKFACNAGASDTRKLAEHVKAVVEKRGLNLSVAWISGDEVWETVRQMLEKEPTKISSITSGLTIEEWGQKGVYAQCYLGGFGIAAAFERGADIVICGRVADASPLIGAAAWWHSWNRDSLDELAGAFVSGHLTECSTYVTGGNFSGFKVLRNKWSDIGYPIVDIYSDGSSVISMEEGLHGLVTVETCTAQLLYEIQGPLYYNSDVVADLRTLKFEQIGKNQVRAHGVRGLRPPPTTKVGITARGGFQAEVRFFFVGLDIAEKAAMMEAQFRENLPAEKEFTLLKFMTTGTPAVNPKNQSEATVEFRIFAQTKDAAVLHPSRFLGPLSDQVMQSAPGGTFGLDMRMGFPKPFFEYFVTIMPQSEVQHRAHLLSTNEVIDIPPPTKTIPFVLEQETYDPKNPTPLSNYGPTTMVPLGRIIHGRSGDKGSDANVGLFARYTAPPDEYEWLRSFVTIEGMKELLGEDYNGKRIERIELPNLRAVHFLLKDHLDRGVSSSSTYDYLGKNVAEYVRCKLVPVPNIFLVKPHI